MRFELALVAAVCLAGCDEKPAGPAPSRFASVKKSAQTSAAKFCEKTWPANGDGAKPFVAAVTRPFGAAAGKVAGWKWVNVWATWCKPCVEEMGVLLRWRDAISREGLPLTIDLLSIDETANQPALEEWKGKNLPGPISWIKSEEDFGVFLDGLGVDRNAAIPIHVLVDPANKVRCVRVGAIHEANYGSVRDLLAGG